MSDSDEPLFCSRCGAVLTPGRGSFYVVRIEAFADPTPPRLECGEFERLDPEAEIRRCIEQMEGLTERDLADTVYRRLTLHLCGRCYGRWIENPAGG